jgi:hypothetical protein
MVDRRGAYKVFMARLDGKRPLGRPRRRWEDNIKMDLSRSGMGRHGLGWIAVTEDRGRWRALLNAVMNLRFP